MLLSLHIENIAIIEKTDIDFSKGFIVLTGETGAGKSIIIDSINLLLGTKGSKELISTGKEYAFVSAVFTGFSDSQCKLLEQNGVCLDEDGNIVVSRKINKDGRSLSKINGQPVNVSLLKIISSSLVTVFGQHDGSKILDPSSHIEYLDAYCHNDHLIAEYKTIYGLVKQARNKITELSKINEDKEKLEDNLNFQIKEIELADLHIGEYQKLSYAKNTVSNKAIVTQSLYSAESILSDESHGVLYSVNSLVDELKKLDGIVDGVSKLVVDVESAKFILQDASAFVSGHLLDFEEDEYSLDYIEERLHIIEKIVKKYGGSEEKALEYLLELKSQLEKINDNDAELESAMAEYQNLLCRLEGQAEKLSVSRKKGAIKLAEEIALQLRDLDMPQVEFCVDIVRSANARGGTKYTNIGFDCVEFLISANKGQQPKPIVKIASGGELSRIMLCLKSALADKGNDCDTFIYDEVDSGVSGATAQKIGNKLKLSSNNKQVFCVTHLAQIAAMADLHFKVEKNLFDGEGVKSNVRLLEYSERIDEIARIMGGVDMTEQLYKSAKEMIDISLK